MQSTDMTVSYRASQAGNSENPTKNLAAASKEEGFVRKEPAFSRSRSRRLLDRGALQRNGRDSFAEIGKAIGLSATSVAERIDASKRPASSKGIAYGSRPRSSATR